MTFVPSDAPHGPLGLSKAAGGFARAVTAAGRPDVTTTTLIDPEFLDVERAFDMRGDDIPASCYCWWGRSASSRARTLIFEGPPWMMRHK